MCLNLKKKPMTTPLMNDLMPELEFQVSRSSGPGGQNVNKVNSRVTLRFDVPNSIALTADQKEWLIKKLASRLTSEGVLMFSVQDQRSQLQNKEAAIARFNDIIVRAFTPVKKRKATKPTKSSSKKRVESKKKHAEKKKWRQKF